MLLFAGEFPGDQVIPRFYIFHVLLVPGVILALMAAHLILIFFHKHTQWPGPGRKEKNVVGYPFLPVYVAKTTGFFFLVFGTLTLMGGILDHQPVVEVRPVRPDEGDRRVPAGLVHGLARWAVAADADLGDRGVGLPGLVEHHRPDPGHAVAPVDGGPAAAVHRGVAPG